VRDVIEAVLLFGAMNILFEFVLLSMLKPRTRLRVLGSANYRNLLHIGFLLLNLMIHWGTLIGTMSAVMAFISSLVTVQIAMKLFGYVVDSQYYHVGLIKYSVKELQ
jgi:ABC-type protease/lipase transport system fused ATPase/permease subunit